MFAVSMTRVVGFGNPISPLGAITLSGPISETANVVRPILKRRLKASQPPLNRGKLCTWHLLGAVGLAVDQDECHGGGASGLLSQDECRQWRLRKGGLEQLCAELGAKSFPRSTGFVQGIAKVPRGGMKGTKCSLCGFEIGRGNIKDKPASLRELGLVTGQADFATAAQWSR